MKRLKNFQRKLKKTLKAIGTYNKQKNKNYKSMKTKISKIWLLLALFIMCACGSTKVMVDKPAAGTQTTITVTTNNPITTNVDAKADAQLNTK